MRKKFWTAVANPLRAAFTVYVRWISRNSTDRLSLVDRVILWILASCLVPFTSDGKKRINYLRYMQSLGLSAVPNRYFEPIPAVVDVDTATTMIGHIAADPGETEDMTELQDKLSDPLIVAAFERSLAHIQSNRMFHGLDAFAYTHFIRKTKPKRIVEVGSGYSAFVALEASSDFKSEVISVEPYPVAFLESLAESEERHTLIRKRVQDTDSSLFTALGAGDILFVDSTHVCCTGGDLPTIFCHILPSLEPGVLIHFHDVSWPYEYPRRLVYEKGRFYNELYLLGAVLGHGSYQFLFGSYHFLVRKGAWLNPNSGMPYSSGMSLWMRKRSVLK